MEYTLKNRLNDIILAHVFQVVVPPSKHKINKNKAKWDTLMWYLISITHSWLLPTITKCALCIALNGVAYKEAKLGKIHN